MAEFSSKLQECRLRANLSQAALARLVGIDPSYLSKIESEDRDPPQRDVVRRLGNALGLTFQEKNELLLLAGYAPIDAEEMRDTHPVVNTLFDIVDSDNVPKEEKDLIYFQLRQIRRRYLGEDSE